MNDNSDNADAPSQPRGSGLFAALLLLVLVGVVTANWAFRRSEPSATSGAATIVGDAVDLADPDIVTVTIDRPGKSKMLGGMPHKAGMTVLELMQELRNRGDEWQYEVQGSGRSALILELASVKNGSESGKFWLYEVNGKLADVGVGVYELSAGDDVLWKFTRNE